MLRLLPIGTVLATLVVSASLLAPSEPARADRPDKLDPILRELLTPRRRAASAEEGGVAVPRGASPRRLESRGLLATVPAGQPEQAQRATADAGPQDDADEHARVRVLLQASDSDEELTARGARVHARIGDVVAADLPVSALGPLASLEGVARIEAAATFTRFNDLAAADSGAARVRDELGLDGASVVVGVIDSGLDICHADFRTPAGQTRVKALLDVSAWPASTTYSEAQLNAQLQACPSAPLVDTVGHGTHVAGTAAGDGSASGGGSAPAGTYEGVAPAADLVIVKTDLRTDGILAGLQFIQSQATGMGKKWVANMSFGTHFGAHDGTSLLERAIDQATNAGGAVVVAAGNEGQSPIHASALVTQVAPGGPSQDIRVSVPGGATVAQFDFWYEGTDSFRVGFTAPDGFVAPAASSGLGLDNTSFPCWRFTATEDWRCFDVFHRTASENGDHRVVIAVYTVSSLAADAQPIPGGAPAGTWTIEFEGASVVSGRLDGWTSGCRTAIGGDCSSPFTSHVDYSRTVAIPGTAQSAITVGAYSTRPGGTAVGALAAFSSRGPTRDGRLKPDLAAPGTSVISSLSADGSPPGTFQPGGLHVALQGTSMSAAHATGAVALLLEGGAASGASAKSMLLANARADSFTGAVPNDLWGRGKLDVYRALCASLVTCGAPAPTTGSITIRLDAVPDSAQDFTYVGSLGTFSLDDDSDATFPTSRTFTGIGVGGYSITQVTPGGWTLVGLGCADPNGNSSSDLATGQAIVRLEANESVTCTFTTTQQSAPATGAITIIEDLQPDGPDDFTFAGSGPGGFSFDGGFVLDDDGEGAVPAVRTFSGLAPGTYALAQSEPSGFTLTSASCEDATGGSFTSGGSATISLAAGESVICTFTNAPVSSSGTGTGTGGSGGGGGGAAGGVVPPPAPPAPPVVAGPPPSVLLGLAPGRGLIGLLVVGAQADSSVLLAELAVAGCDVGTLAVIPAGRWLVYIPGAPAQVNAAFPPRLDALTPFFVRCAA